MLKFFSFCCNINRILEKDLLFALKLLLSSLDYYVKEYEFILYTNFNIIDIEILNNKNLKIRNYYDNSIINYYNDIWLNMSFNKINIYKDLYDEFNDNYIWIDLDTIITYDISYLEHIDNFFIEHGGNCVGLKHEIIKNNFYVPVNKYIQGALWKININLYHLLINLYNELCNKNLRIEYDTQGLFSYYIYHTLNGELDKNNINIYGVNFKNNTINGLGIWSNDENKNKHPNVNSLENMYYENNILKTKYYPDKEIHFFMLTFYTLNKIKHSSQFKKLFGHLLIV
jgi:hypothetical protein